MIELPKLIRKTQKEKERKLLGKTEEYEKKVKSFWFQILKEEFEKEERQRKDEFHFGNSQI